LEGRLEYPISVSTNAYPITVRWEAVKPMVLYAGGKMAGAMEGSGAIQLKSAAGLAVVMGSGVNIPKVFALGQNYPNPFNPVTRFSYDVPKLVEVQIAVYNLLGQKVKTLLSGETSPGSYEMEWAGTDGQGVSVPTGIYFIRMSADDFKATQKVMLMK
jgi:FlgD Ig-like domain